MTSFSVITLLMALRLFTVVSGAPQSYGSASSGTCTDVAAIASSMASSMVSSMMAASMAASPVASAIVASSALPSSAGVFLGSSAVPSSIVEPSAASVAGSSEPSVIPSPIIAPSAAGSSGPSVVPSSIIVPSAAGSLGPSIVASSVVAPSAAGSLGPSIVAPSVVAPSAAGTSSPSVIPSAAAESSVAASATVASPVPASSPVTTYPASTDAATSYWLSSIARQGIVAYGASGYQIFRNVKDFGAKGDGSTDDTAAINSAISTGDRCGQGCDSSTTTPALVYFPPGTYVVSAPIIQYYYTQLVGDAITIPTIKASASFKGIAVIDSDPYDAGGDNWYGDTNNFYRQVRNFVIDITGMPASSGAGIHWQVAQATSLQNIVFNMRSDGGTSNKQQGIFMDNGSGGFMTDLTFNGGNYGAYFGNQQFTTRNLTFNGCQTAVYMNWNWVWTLSGVTINNCQIGVDMTSGGTTAQTVGSILLVDSTISNTPIGISTDFSPDDGATNGTLLLDNVDFSNNVPIAVSNGATNATILAGNTKIASWEQGRVYPSNGTGTVVQDTFSKSAKPTGLLNSAGRVFTRSKPQYETVPVSSFKSAKAAGAKGDGVTDDTAAIQALFNSAGSGDVVYFDHGAYVITNTVTVPKNIRITGEIWPLIMAGGTAFKDQANPKPVFQVGQVGDTGSVEISDLVFETLGPQPGAIMIEWNVAQTSQGSVGMWDVHMRIGGSAGTQLQYDKCPASNTTNNALGNPACEGAFLLLYVTKQASIYLENNWFWVADHELDLSGHKQTTIYNGRGVLIESTQPVWLFGTSSEHSVLYNYQIANAANVYMALIQTETPYYQSNPDAKTPFTTNPAYSDPVFSGNSSNNKAWGLRIVDSQNVVIHGAGLYSFFDNYSELCLATESCQENMVSVENSTSISIYGLSTKAAVNMLSLNGKSVALDQDNRNGFCATIARFTS